MENSLKSLFQFTFGNAIDNGYSGRPFKSGTTAFVDVKILQEASVRDKIVDKETLSPAFWTAKASQPNKIFMFQRHQYLQSLQELGFIRFAARLCNALHRHNRPIPQDSLVYGRETAFPQQIDFREALSGALHFF